MMESPMMRPASWKRIVLNNHWVAMSYISEAWRRERV